MSPRQPSNSTIPPWHRTGPSQSQRECLELGEAGGRDGTGFFDACWDGPGDIWYKPTVLCLVWEVGRSCKTAIWLDRKSFISVISCYILWGVLSAHLLSGGLLRHSGTLCVARHVLCNIPTIKKDQSFFLINKYWLILAPAASIPGPWSEQVCSAQAVVCGAGGLSWLGLPGESLHNPTRIIIIIIPTEKRGTACNTTYTYRWNSFM